MIVSLVLCVVYVCTKIAWANAYTADDAHMIRALELASLGTGVTTPNPCVGCVIVDEEGRVVGEGWHAKAGEAHAEVNALIQAGEKASGSTAFVSLEPCNHFGRTPPCTHALLKAGIKKVVVGIVDPDPRVSGAGLEFLKSKGIEVEVGVQQTMCLELNRPFIFRVLNKRSYATCWLDLSVAEEEEKNQVMATLQMLSDMSPESDIVILSMDQALDSMKAAGGAMRWRELVSLLPPGTAVGICLRENEEKEEIERLIEDYNDESGQDSRTRPRLVKLALQAESGGGVRPVLEKSLELGFNAAVLLAKDEQEVEKWGLEGHCQHMIVCAKAREVGTGIERGEGEGASAPEPASLATSLTGTPFSWARPHYLRLKSKMRDICNNEKCNARKMEQSSWLEKNGITYRQENDVTLPDDRLVSPVHRPGTLLLGCHTWSC